MLTTITASSFTAEEILYIAAVLDEASHKSRRSVIEKMRLCLPGNIVSDDEKEFITKCIGKLEQITDAAFNRINFLSAWPLEIADYRPEFTKEEKALVRSFMDSEDTNVKSVIIDALRLEDEKHSKLTGDVIAKLDAMGDERLNYLEFCP